MKVFLLCLLFALGCLYLCQAAPAGEEPNVNYLRYKNDQDFEAIKRQIIAQYDQLGGSSQFHEVRSATIVDPHNIKINI